MLKHIMLVMGVMILIGEAAYAVPLSQGTHINGVPKGQRGAPSAVTIKDSQAVLMYKAQSGNRATGGKSSAARGPTQADQVRPVRDLGLR